MVENESRPIKAALASKEGFIDRYLSVLDILHGKNLAVGSRKYAVWGAGLSRTVLSMVPWLGILSLTRHVMGSNQTAREHGCDREHQQANDDLYTTHGHLPDELAAPPDAKE